MREVDEKSKLSDARNAKMKAENLDLKCRIDKISSELATKEDLLTKEKEKLSKLTKHIDSYRKKCLALAKKQRASAAERDALAKSNIEKKNRIKELLKVVENNQEMLQQNLSMRQTSVEFDRLNSSRT